MANELAKTLLPYVTNANVVAFGHVVKEGEVKDHTDAGYGIVNSAAHVPPIIDFSDHPYRGMLTTHGGFAAGAYQAIPSTWEDFIRDCGQRDFSKPSQDLFLVYRLWYRKALDAVLAGDLGKAIRLCHLEWTSLPGAAENKKYTMEQATKVYMDWGGGLSVNPDLDTQPAAPIEHHDQPLETVMPEATAATPQQPSAIDSIAGVVSLINPAAGGVIGLAGKLLEMFKPNVVAKINSQIGKQTTDVATEATTMVSQAQVLTGKQDPFDAVAAARADPAVLAQIQQSASDRMDNLIKAADKSITYDQAMWSAQLAGRQASSSIAIEEHRAGLWDMTPMMVVSLLIMLWGIAWGLLAAILVLVFKDKTTVDPMMLPVLVAIAGPIWTGAIVSTVVAMVAYRFDGTKDASMQTKALVNAASDRKSS